MPKHDATDTPTASHPDVGLDAVAAELISLRSEFKQVAVSLRDAARRLQAGKPPHPNVASSLVELGDRFQQLLQQLAADTPGDVSLHDLQHIMDRKRAEHDRLAGLIEEVLALRPTPGISGEADRALQALQADLKGHSRPGGARETSGSSSGLADESLEKLLTLVKAPQTVGDEDWERLTERFGKPLVIAAARNHIAPAGKEGEAEPARPPDPRGTPKNAEGGAAPAESEAEAEVDGHPPAAEPADPAPPAEPGADAAPGRATDRLEAAGDSDREGHGTDGCDPSGDGLGQRPPHGVEPTAAADSCFAGTVPTESRPAAATATAWQLLDKDALGLALGWDDPAALGLPAWLVRAHLLAPHLLHGSGDIALALADCVSAADPTGLDSAGELLAMAALTVPPVVAPGTGAQSVVRALPLRGLAETYALAQIIADESDRLPRGGIDRRNLESVRDRSTWTAQREQLRREAEEWWQKATAASLLGPATGVWREWIKKDGLVSRLVAPILSGEPIDHEQMTAALRAVSDSTRLRAEVKETERRIRGTGVEPIHARALTGLQRKAVEAAGLAERWLELEAANPDKRRSDHLSRSIGKLRERAVPAMGKSRAELRELTSTEAGSTGAAARMLLESYEQLEELFAPVETVPAAEPAAQLVINSCLLRASVAFDADWQLAADESVLAEVVRAAAETGLPSWKVAFDTAIARQDLLAAERIVGAVPLSDDGTLDLEEAAGHLAAAQEGFKSSLADELSTLRTELEVDLANGVIDESTRALHDSMLIDLQRGLDDLKQFGPIRAIMASIAEALHEARERRVGEAQEEVDRQLPTDSPERDRILAVLERGDVFTAREYLDLVRDGQVLPETIEDRDPLREFFERQFDAIHETLRTVKPLMIANHIAKGARLKGLDIGRVPQKQRQSAAAMISSWFELARSRRADPDKIDQVLRGLGMLPLTGKISVVQRDPRGEWAALEFETAPLKDRAVCPVAIFGSRAAGLYRILCTWQRPSEDEILKNVKALDDALGAQRPTFVFHFGPMTAMRRKDLALRSRELGRTFLVLDDVLLLFLCGERGLRLPVLFQCALPFTTVQPYETSVNLVPPELFYGRRDELAAVSSRGEGVLVYGGRQLGKTALLRHAEREFHNPASGQVAAFIDLKVEGIGVSKAPEELWSVLAERLSDHGLSFGKRKDAFERLRSGVMDWLAKGPSRNLLVLLDEADRFLDADTHKGFREADRLRGLMESSGHRFKVVLAGLHNVLRTTDTPNHPLGQFGRPIAVGPLIRNGEWRQARALVEKPLHSLGYRFESPDLLAQILAFTNYYPKLIQLVCHELVTTLKRPQKHARKFTVPISISSSEVDEVLRSADLRQYIREVFHLTLQLDPRYDFLTYLIAHYVTSGLQPLEKGLSVAEIEQEGRDWWPDGFRRLTRREVEALLEETATLGVLRRVEDGDKPRYTLRNPNVLLLLGSKEDIEAALLKDRELPSSYDPSAFRSQHPSRPGRRSPLTDSDLALLRSSTERVTPIVGCAAAGIDDLGDYLAKEFGSGLAVAEPLAASELSELARDAEIVLLPADAPWDEGWLPAKAAYRVFRAMDPDAADAEGAAVWNDDARVALRPWSDAAVRAWLEDQALPSERAIRERVARATGGWPTLLYRLLDQLQSAGGRNIESACDALDAWIATDGARVLLRDFGMDSQRARALGLLRDDAATTVAELVEVLDEPPEALQATLSWAELLGLAYATRSGWLVDPIVARVIHAAG